MNSKGISRVKRVAVKGVEQMHASSSYAGGVAGIGDEKLLQGRGRKPIRAYVFLENFVYCLIFIHCFTLRSSIVADLFVADLFCIFSVVNTHLEYTSLTSVRYFHLSIFSFFSSVFTHA